MWLGFQREYDDLCICSRRLERVVINHCVGPNILQEGRFLPQNHLHEMIKLVRDLLNRLKAAESVFKDALQLSMPPKHDARVHPIHPPFIYYPVRSEGAETAGLQDGQLRNVPAEHRVQVKIDHSAAPRHGKVCAEEVKLPPPACELLSLPLGVQWKEQHACVDSLSIIRQAIKVKVDACVQMPRDAAEELVHILRVVLGSPLDAPNMHLLVPRLLLRLHFRQSCVTTDL
mmetsp:Transcript_705/g.2848  ORF Transcript_705/g.2848 Transcript_705/m.2848 type:complete len:230 (+) Transcript_705:328-1017(+)